MQPDVQLTELIYQMQRGDRAAGESVFSAAAARLRRMAHALMTREKTLSFHASDLVQETYAQKVAAMRLRTKVESREHFFSIMAAGMRQVLADRGRLRNARKRQPPPVEQLLQCRGHDPQLTDLSLALRKLRSIDRQGAELIQMKFHEGLSWEELAQRTGRTVWQLRDECEYVVRWLREQLS